MKKNNLSKILGFIILVPFILSCDPPVTSSNGLSILSNQSELLLYNATSDSCASTNTNVPAPDKAIKPVSFQLRGLELYWKEAQALTIETITITLTSPALSTPKECKFTSTDLLSTWIYFHGAVDPTSGAPLGGPVNTAVTISNATAPLPAAPTENTVYTKNACPFRCGDIKFIDNKQSAMGSAEVKIDGYVDKGDGTFGLVSLKKYMTFTYTPQ